jgi:hypothetical protein
MRWILIEDTGTFLLVDCPMVRLKVTLDECERCPYHGGKRKDTLKETIVGDPQHLFITGSIACNFPGEGPTTL